MSSILAKGQNMSLPDDVVRIDVVLGWTEAEIEVDASALLLKADGKVSSDGDFVFYNQPESPDGSVRFLGTSATEEGAQARIAIDLSVVSDTIHAIALAGSIGTGTFGQLGKLAFRVVDGAGHSLAEYVTADATTESAFVFGEVYRRGGQWKVRAVGQGWESGLAGLATDFGVDVDDDAEQDSVEQPLRDAPMLEPEVIVSATVSPAERNVPEANGKASARVDMPTRRSSGVRTAKLVARKAKPMEFKLAEHEAWQPARLFSVFGVGAGEEQERRATSALIATMQAVRPFARALCARMGAPAGAFEGYVEVQYHQGESTVIPDAVLKVVRGGRVWTGLLEVKTGNAKLKREQLESYLEVARRNKYDAVVSLSNDVPAGPGELPVQVDRRKLAKVALRHLSWAEVMHEARMLLSHGGIDDDLQSWISSEFLRYLVHPRSGASELVDMGRHWVAVRDSVVAGTLRAGDQKVLTVADAWTSLSRHLALRLTAELGVTVKHILPRRHRTDPSARTAAVAERLAGEGTFEAVLQIPDTAGDLMVIADVRTNRIRCRTTLDAPSEGGAGRRLSWLLRQLEDAPGDVQVEAVFSVRGNEACEHLDTVRGNPKVLTQGRAGEIVSFSLEKTFPMGNRRSGSGTAATFIASVTAATDAFYGSVVQPLRGWVPPAPKQPEPSNAEGVARVDA
ncbi:stress response protein, TerZ- and CABP1 [Nocardia sputorum]|uniref:TerD family protein n=1 Tax=Nocardia sputorum TaxID=2984338 RepID=UPI002490BAB4|nr:TerD family protein [Nocardia sputorum]BDT91946.1 stress response protein, TerZ- and CABP1 [Nocardia sputorum]